MIDILGRAIQMKDTNIIKQLSTDFWETFEYTLFYQIVGDEVWCFCENEKDKNLFRGFILGWEKGRGMEIK